MAAEYPSAPISTITGLPCAGHDADHRCIECATDHEIRIAIVSVLPPYPPASTERNTP